MKWLALLVGLAFLSPVLAYKDYSPDHPVHVDPYYKRGGEHVGQYYRSEPHQHDNDPFYNKESNDY